MVKLRLPTGLFMAAGDSSSTMDLTKFLNVRRHGKARTLRLPVPPPPPPPLVLGVSSSDKNNDRSPPVSIGSEATDHILSEKATGSSDDDHDSVNSKRTLEGTEIKGDEIQKTDSREGDGEIRETDDDQIWKTSSSSSSDIDIKNQVVSSVNQNVVPKTYACSVCGKTFTTHLALGGHKSSHTKFKMIICDAVDFRPSHKQLSITNTCDPQAATRPQPLGVHLDRAHTCKICSENFPSGQALGGHQRRHWTGNKHKAPKILDFDLNELPKVEDDQDISFCNS